MKLLQIHPDDNVAVALSPVAAGELSAQEPIPQGHKLALRDIAAGEAIIKYGNPIGYAASDISEGHWVHTHNVRTGLSENASYTYNHKVFPLPAQDPLTFSGFQREQGKVGIRNEIWILPTVGCVNCVAQTLAKDNQNLVDGSVDGIYAFTHPFGCSQMGDDHAQTRKLLAALAHHPNAGGVLVLGLGCENLTMAQFREELGDYDPDRIKFLVCQESSDEYAEGRKLLAELCRYAASFQREELPASELIVGMKCGGSDGLSGITANPTVGKLSDCLVSLGGTSILTEVPEMFGAEGLLFDRCENEAVFHDAVKMVEDFKQYYVNHGQVVYENPSPGNKAGGITTLEDKSCGCVQKGGHAQITDILAYGDRVRKKGLNLLSGPGNDLVSATALAAAGAHVILFTTGRGTPFGSPVPTVKISTNTALSEKKSAWIDFNAGTVAEGQPIEEAARQLLDLVLNIASGSQTKSESLGAREISIWKDGVVL